jgi:hypothetical protein
MVIMSGVTLLTGTPAARSRRPSGPVLHGNRPLLPPAVAAAIFILARVSV